MTLNPSDSARQKYLVMVQFNFANLCGYFSFVAVSVLLYRRGRQERAKKRKGMPALFLQTEPVPNIC